MFGPDVPEGFRYQDEFIDASAEARLIDDISGVKFSTFEMRGVAARRRVAFFGRAYDAGRAASPELPPFLLPVRERLAAWVGVDAEAFAMALINEYPPGAPIGWHRDAPQYDIVAGLSLLSPCHMKLRRYVSPAALRPGVRRAATHDLVLRPRSAYLLSGPARTAYEHHIPAVATLRYSITFRTLRDRQAPFGAT